VLFFLLYWHLPARPIPFRSSVVAATFTALGYELLKGAFAWYATSVSVYSSILGGDGCRGDSFLLDLLQRGSVHPLSASSARA